MDPSEPTEPITTPLDPFERSVIGALLQGADPFLDHLRGQVASATVRDREHNDYGQFTDLWVPDGVTPIEVTDRFALDDLYGTVQGCTEEVGFLLHIVRGRVKTLEAFVSRPGWPQNPQLVEHWYVSPDPDPESGGQVRRVEERDLDFALRGTGERDEED